MSDKETYDFYLGELNKGEAAFLEHMISIGKCGLTVMEKMGLGDPNRIYVAKILTRNKKKLNFKFE